MKKFFRRLLLIILCIIAINSAINWVRGEIRYVSAKKNISQGEIVLDKGYFYYIGMPVDEVCEKLSSLGFQNIELISVEPEKTEDFNRVNEVIINSNSSFKKGDRFLADSLIQIEFKDEFYFKGNIYSSAFVESYRGSYPRTNDYSRTYIIMSDDGKLVIAKHNHETRHGDRYWLDMYDYNNEGNNIIVYEDYKGEQKFLNQRDSLVTLHEDGTEGTVYKSCDLSSAMKELRNIASHR